MTPACITVAGDMSRKAVRRPSEAIRPHRCPIQARSSLPFMAAPAEPRAMHAEQPNAKAPVTCLCAIPQSPRNPVTAASSLYTS